MNRPSERLDALAGSAAVYVHVPFCSAVCPYCDFAVVAGRDDMAQRYVAAVITEIERASPWRPLEAVYFGGGTPSRVGPELLGTILEALVDRHGLAGGAEVSLQANPEDFDGRYARQVAAIGFNRISFGAQSFDNAVLAYLGRRHKAGDITDSVIAARQGGLREVSLDLIYGAPAETSQSWEDSLTRATSLEPDHLSCYALTVERGTPLARAVAAGSQAPDPDTQADRYETASQLLELEGLRRYEVSNWAEPGSECRYNLIVWAQGEYEAYGNGAHGYRDGVRFRNHRRLDAYLAAVELGKSPRAGEDSVTGWEQELDRLFVGLRRAVGVAHGPGTRAMLESENGRDLARAGVIAYDDERLWVTDPLLTDAVERVVLSLHPPIVTLVKHA